MGLTYKTCRCNRRALIEGAGPRGLERKIFSHTEGKG